MPEVESDTKEDDRNVDSDSLKRKRAAEEENISDANRLRKTRGIHTDYRKLNDPFTHWYEVYADEEDEVTASLTGAILGGDEPKSLKEAKESPEWPEWERAIQAELEQLRNMGTWSLVDKPMSAIPIANKWVFTIKYGKCGELLKYKGKLVAKGCVQRPGYDYLETFSPVVRLETIRVILALAAIHNFVIQQMDVKGAYLNSTLEEKVYMRQLEGYNDGTGQVYLIEKTLYRFKQFGHEWNRELDRKLCTHSFGT
jgi:hypothetical protein